MIVRYLECTFTREEKSILLFTPPPLPPFHFNCFVSVWHLSSLSPPPPYVSKHASFRPTPALFNVEMPWNQIWIHSFKKDLKKKKKTPQLWRLYEKMATSNKSFHAPSRVICKYFFYTSRVRSLCILYISEIGNQSFLSLTLGPSHPHIVSVEL